MDYGQIELELDAVETHGAGRVPQEMAKSAPAEDIITASPHPKGINPPQLAAKKARTAAAVEAPVTQVLRKEG